MYGYTGVCRVSGVAYSGHVRGGDTFRCSHSSFRTRFGHRTSLNSSFHGSRVVSDVERYTVTLNDGYKNGGLNMMFDNLAGKLGQTIRKLQGADKLTEKNIAASLKDVRRALLDADVNLKVVNELLKDVKERAIGTQVTEGVEPGQQFIQIIYEELAKIMGSDESPLATGSPAVVLLAGLQGAGKTTAAAKLALYCVKEKRKVLLVAADIYRPAAIEQLKTLGKKTDTEVFSLGTELPADQICREAIAYAKKNGFDTVIVDTAGRQVIDLELMDELKKVKAAVNAQETLLVVDAMTGQEAANLTRAFNEQVGITGAILTKLDGDTRGGAALSVQKVSGRPIKFVGVGEQVEKLEPFYPKRMASRILGMGDVVSFVEKAQEAVEEKEALEITKRLMKAEFDFNDFLKQTAMMSKMGSFSGMLKMIPGMSGMKEEQIALAEKKLKLSESLIFSMTRKERLNPDLLIKDRTSRSRLTRIAKGSGRTYTQASALVTDFQKMRTMMQRMTKSMIGDANVDELAAASANGDAMSPMQPGMGGNRSARRKGDKKKEKSGGQKRGFGR